MCVQAVGLGIVLLHCYHDNHAVRCFVMLAAKLAIVLVAWTANMWHVEDSHIAMKSSTGRL